MRMLKKLLIGALALLCIVYLTFAERNAGIHGNSKVRKSTQEHSADRQVVITPPVLRGFPSFDITGTEGKILLYRRIQCSDEIVKPGHKIPNVIHYVWFGRLTLNAVQYYSIRSTALIQRPKFIIFHMDHPEPGGPYWERLKEEVSCLRTTYRKMPESVMGRPISLVEHKSDVARLEILSEYGGIYCDVNVFFIRALDPLMKHSAVLGKEEDRSYGNSFIMAEKNASFIQLWRSSYINFDHTRWSDHSTVMPRRLHKWFPEIPLHVEQYSMMRPNYMDGEDWLFYNNWDLRYNYCVHLYVNEPTVKDALEAILQHSESDIVTLDNTFGQLVRISLFGTPYFKVDDLDNKLLRVHSPVQCSEENVDQRIPNIIHYVWNGERIQYQHYLGVRSALQMLKPSAVYFHLLVDKDPFYQPYLMLIREVTCIKMLNQTGAMQQQLQSNISAENKKLLTSLQILEEYGGALLDLNVTMLRPSDDFFALDFAIGEKEDDFDYSVVIAKPRSSITRGWSGGIANGLRPSVALLTILQSTDETFLVNEQIVAAPQRGWFETTGAHLPFARSLSFRNSGWDSLETDRNEKELMLGTLPLGTLARSILLG